LSLLDAGATLHYVSRMFASATPPPPESLPLITEPAGVLAVLLAVLATIFWAAHHPLLGKVFKIIPLLVFCYFVPTTLATAGLIPHSSPLYEWIKSFLLPASLLLLVLAVDVPGILRLGPKAVIMLLTGTAGVVLGRPVSTVDLQGFAAARRLARDGRPGRKLDRGWGQLRRHRQSRGSLGHHDRAHGRARRVGGQCLDGGAALRSR
jgi:hypothetical protein